jgi:predicted MFS family arabinose efflux permease
MGTGLWSLNLNYQLKVKSLSEAQIGLALAVSAITTALLSVVLGRVCDRMGFKPAMVAGCIFKGAGMLLTAVVPSFGMIITAQLIIGFGDALVLSSEFPYLLSLVEEKYRSTVYNLLISVFMFFMIIGNIVGGFLPGTIADERMKYMIPLIAAGTCFIILGSVRARIPNNSVTCSKGTNILSLFCSGRIMMFLLYGVIGGCFYNMLTSMNNLIFKENLGYSEGNVGIIYSVVNGTSFLVTLLIPFILLKYKSKNIAAITFVMIVICTVLLSFSNTSRVVFLAVWIILAGLRIILPGTVDSSMLQTISFEQQGAYSGARIFANQVGLSMGAYVTGNILMYSNISTLMFFAAGIALIQFAIYSFGCRRYL